MTLNLTALCLSLLPGVSMPATERQVSNKTAETTVKQGALCVCHQFRHEYLCYLSDLVLKLSLASRSLRESLRPNEKELTRKGNTVIIHST